MSKWPNTVTIGSFVADLDAPGDYRLTTEIEGWGSPARRLSTSDLTGRSGVMIAGAYYGARTIVHSGFIEQATSEAANDIADTLAAFQPGTPIPYIVDHVAIGARQITGRVAVGPDPSWIDDRSFTYSITIVAPNPFKTGLTAVTVDVAAGTTEPVDATVKYPAEIEVTTTSSGTVDLTIAGLRLRTDSLPSGSVLTSGPGFANPKRTIRSSSGANLFGLIVQPMQWPAISPGANSLVNAGTADLSVRYFPTYA